MITANGLRPKLITSRVSSLTPSEVYEKTLRWIKDNEEKYDLSVEEKVENEAIHLTSIKSNAVTLKEQYFYAKYSISISFENEQYKFEPTKIQLKLNSKYDMGWKDFDLNDGSMFYKKGKPIRKYKAYINDLVTQLNEIHIRLGEYLKEW